MRKSFSLKKNLWNKYNSTISSINQTEPELQILSNSELKERSKKLKIKSHEIESQINPSILVESFALVREASRRTLGLRHYDTQLLGGLVLNDNQIAEMRTGEGKTLVATAPVFANALSGKGVHIVTANEYLAQRDAEWMGQIYRSLDLKVGLVKSQMESTERRKNYNRDILYTTNNELGFDYLRDNLVTQITDLVQRPFHYCIVDEVDSILIDEARTPLIISGKVKSGQARVELEKIIKAAEVVKYMVEFTDYEVDKKAKNVSLTSLGIKKVQKLLNVENLYTSGEPWIQLLLNALKAKALFLKDIHYIVKNKEIVIVDEFTGRLMEGRKWAEGLHSAIEAKENIYNIEGSETIASITFQNFFRLYPKIAGMTGTAKTEELEFENIYNLSVSVLPTFKPVKRQDFPDAIYMDEITKWKAIARECKNKYEKGQPVLVGTTTIQNSEILSSLLLTYKIPHELLNAKPENIKRESEIVAQAGCLSSVTIATNMAGRGTDILLGGNPEFKASRQTIDFLEGILNNNQNDIQVKSFQNSDFLVEQLNQNSEILLTLHNNFETLLNLINIPNKPLNKLETIILNIYKSKLTFFQNECKRERQRVLDLGGLYVIGSERHESRRIDNQLRGRAGRQGDPGSSRFFLSLNDPLLKTFGGERIKSVMQVFQLNEEALESKFLTKSLDNAQQKVEGFYYDQRKTLNKYDQVLDKQRSILYEYRKRVLISSTIRDLLLEFGEAIIDDLIYFMQKKDAKVIQPKRIYELLYALSLSIEPGKNFKPLDFKNLKIFLCEQFWSVYSLKELKFWFYNIELFRNYEKFVFLKYIDSYWSEHLENMNFLKDAVTWEAYAQRDPFLQYEEKAFILFNKTFKQCRNAIIYDLLNIDIV